MKNKFLFAFISLMSLFLFSFQNTEAKRNSASDTKSPDSLDIKIGQMIMLGINSRTAIEQNDPLFQELRDQKLGGIVLFEKHFSRRIKKQFAKSDQKHTKSITHSPICNH